MLFEAKGKYDCFWGYGAIRRKHEHRCLCKCIALLESLCLMTVSHSSPQANCLTLIAIFAVLALLTSLTSMRVDDCSELDNPVNTFEWEVTRDWLSLGSQFGGRNGAKGFATPPPPPSIPGGANPLIRVAMFQAGRQKLGQGCGAPYAMAPLGKLTCK